MAAIPEIQSYRDSDTLGGLLALSERKDAAEADLARDFIKAMEDGNPYATPAWAGTVPDYEAARRLNISYADKAMPRRPYMLAEALSDALEMRNPGPLLTDVVKVLAMAMKGADPMVALAARQLVERAARTWAEANAPEVE